MRIHIQNVPGDVVFEITQAQFDDSATRASETGHQVSFSTTAEGFAAGMAEAEALVGPPAAIAGKFPVAAPKLKFVSLAAAGVDKVSPLDWVPDGVVLLNNSGVHGGKAGEYVAMALVMLNARVPEMLAAQREAAWRPHFAPTLLGQTVTVVGAGDLGSAAARQARHFGAHVTGVRASGAAHPDFDRMVAPEGLDGVLPETKYLVLACPLTAATRNLLDRRRIALLPPGAGVVNVGRGALLDQDAICDALDSGHLGGAVLDVFVPEPLPAEHRMWRTRNLIVTPHVSADDPLRYNTGSLDIFFSNLRAWRAGEAMPNQVDLARGY